MLEQLTIPINLEDDDLKDSEVTVNLQIDDPHSWKPSKRGVDWDTPNFEIVQVFAKYFSGPVQFCR